MALSRTQYLETQRKLLDLAREMRELPLEEFVETIKTAKAVLPAINPDAFESALKNIDNVERMAVAGLAFKRSIPDVDVVIEGALSAGTFSTVPAPKVRPRGRAFPDTPAEPRRAGAVRDDDPVDLTDDGDVPDPLAGHDFGAGSLHA